MNATQSWDNPGFWGNVTSTVDWCENNYAVSFYVAEFWNTFSSMAMILFGVLGIYLHFRPLGWQMAVGYFMIVIVGIGSVTFHGTLKFENQMWDELPMCWTACWLLWLLLEEHQLSSHTLGAFLTLYCAAMTKVVSGFRGDIQFRLFHLTFGLVMWTALLLVLKTYRETQAHQVRSLFHYGGLYLLLAVLSWLIDTNLCVLFRSRNDTMTGLPNPQLHAWWHLWISMSLHCFFVACGFDSQAKKNRKPQLKYWGWGLPYVEIPTKA